MASETPKQRPERRDDPVEPSLAVGGGVATAPRPHRGFPLSGVWQFIHESIAELKKVEWPKQPQVIQGTGVVLFACLVVGVFLYVSDLAFKHLVQNVFLGQ
jgi:preprotein translocase SecE subunit